MQPNFFIRQLRRDVPSLIRRDQVRALQLPQHTPRSANTHTRALDIELPDSKFGAVVTVPHRLTYIYLLYIPVSLKRLRSHVSPLPPALDRVHLRATTDIPTTQPIHPGPCLIVLVRTLALNSAFITILLSQSSVAKFINRGFSKCSCWMQK